MAAAPPPPPLPRIPMVDLKDGCFNQRGYSFFQQLWSSVQGLIASTVDASNLTSGFLDPARIKAGALPQSTITGLSNPVAVSALGTPTAGLRAFASDSTVAGSGNFGAIVAGGGGFNVPVYADGANWLIG